MKKTIAILMLFIQFALLQDFCTLAIPSHRTIQAIGFIAWVQPDAGANNDVSVVINNLDKLNNRMHLMLTISLLFSLLVFCVLLYTITRIFKRYSLSLLRNPDIDKPLHGNYASMIPANIVTNNGDDVSLTPAIISHSNIDDKAPEDKIPTEDDKKLVKALYEFLDSDRRVYSTYEKDRLTLVSVASILKTNRNTLSHAINTVTHKNFNCLINEFRIREAIRIMSDSDSDRLSMDQIAEKAGFDNRMTFYRNFKSEMRLSPSTYRKSIRVEIVKT